MSSDDFGFGSIGGGTPGASPESARAKDANRDRGKGPPEEDPTPRPGCLQTVMAILLVLVGLAVLVYLIGVVIGLLS